MTEKRAAGAPAPPPRPVAAHVEAAMGRRIQAKAAGQEKTQSVQAAAAHVQRAISAAAQARLPHQERAAPTRTPSPHVQRATAPPQPRFGTAASVQPTAGGSARSLAPHRQVQPLPVRSAGTVQRAQKPSWDEFTNKGSKAPPKVASVPSKHNLNAKDKEYSRLARDLLKAYAAMTDAMIDAALKVELKEDEMGKYNAQSTALETDRHNIAEALDAYFGGDEWDGQKYAVLEGINVYGEEFNTLRLRAGSPNDSDFLGWKALVNLLRLVKRGEGKWIS